MDWINRISETLESAFNTIRPALKNIPPVLLIGEVHRRPGLSAISMSASIIKRLSEAGITSDSNPDGSQNKINSFVYLICQEVVNEIKTNAKVTCVIEPGSVVGTGVGSSPTGPVTVTTRNTMIGKTYGIIE